MKVPKTRTTSREGINALTALIESEGCIFQEVDQQNDFGKDGYIDVAQSGLVTHLCAAVQVKSGKSFRNPDDSYFIPIEGHAQNWRMSTVPVFGIVFDPTDKNMRWVDLTGYLRDHPSINSGSVPVDQSSILDKRCLHADFANTISRYATKTGESITLNLLSDDEQLQVEAVLDSFALGRADSRYLLLLRRLITDFYPVAMRQAIVALSHAGNHPDIFWTEKNWIPEKIKAPVRKAFYWSPDEIAKMIRVIGPEEWGRGTLGQCLDALLFEDPKIVDKLSAATGILLDGDADTATMSAVLALEHSEHPKDAMNLLVETYPALMRSASFKEAHSLVTEWGFISLY
jgi:hypothetical protein